MATARRATMMEMVRRVTTTMEDKDGDDDGDDDGNGDGDGTMGSGATGYDGTNMLE